MKIKDAIFKVKVQLKGGNFELRIIDAVIRDGLLVGFVDGMGADTIVPLSNIVYIKIAK